MMEAKDVKWCPQHGYPLPCYKCGMPLSKLQQKEIYEAGKKAGIREVVEWIKKYGIPEDKPCKFCDGSGWLPDPYESNYNQHRCEFCNGTGRSTAKWQAQLKEWGI